jgi:PKD repeat protein
MKRALALLLAGTALLGILLPGCLTKAENRPPTAVFVISPRAANVGQNIIFDASNSSDKDGKIVRYHWDFDDTTEDLGVSVEHSFSQGGNYTVTLTVTDNEGKKDRANMTVRINQYPKARIDLPGTDLKVLEQVRFSGQGSSDPDGSVVDWKWEFGDGATGTGSQCLHAYAETGIYMVNLTVTDDFGARANRSQAVTVVLRTYEISWNLVPRSLPQVSQYSAENTTSNQTVSIAYDNMTRIEFRLTWTDDIRHWLLGTFNDDFWLRVTDPQNNTQFLRDMKGNISLNFTITDAPSPLTVQAKSPDEALAEVGSRFATSMGRGDWSAQITLGEAEGAQDLTNNDLDLGNNWKLDVRCFVYEMVITEQ